MRFLSREDLITIARDVAHPSRVSVRSQLALRAALTEPRRVTADAATADAVTDEKTIVFGAVAVFATLLACDNPFSGFNLEIAERGTQHLLSENGFDLQVDQDEFIYQLSRVSAGTRSFSQLARWLKLQSVPTDSVPTDKVPPVKGLSSFIRGRESTQ